MYENEQERTKNTVFAVMKCSKLKNKIGDIIEMIWENLKYIQL
jgi:hypothetical protein